MNVDEHADAHRRGWIPDTWSGEGGWVPAYVCCDPRCGGVEPSAAVLDINHYCCDIRVFVGQVSDSHGRHRGGLGHVWFTGYYRGPFTPLWRPAPPGKAEQLDLFSHA